MTPQPTVHATSPSQRATPGTRGSPDRDAQKGQHKGQPSPELAWAHDNAAADALEGDSVNSGFGMPGDRQARMAARRAFVALKLSFLYVVDGLEGRTELQARVRLAEEPEELWALRAPVFAALGGDDAQNRSRRQLLNRSLETMFPTAAPQMN